MLLITLEWTFYQLTKERSKIKNNLININKIHLLLENIKTTAKSYEYFLSHKVFSTQP